MKVLSWNVGYLLGYDGSPWSYAAAPHRALVGSASVQDDALAGLVEVLDREDPDVVCLMEVDRGSVRTRGQDQAELLADVAAAAGRSYAWRSDGKYGTGLLGAVPVMRHLGNAVLWDREGHASAHYLETGPKRLVHEVQLPDGLSLFSVHLSLRRRRRRRQLRELARLMDARDRAVACGDFNTFAGSDGFDPIASRVGLDVHTPGETVPSHDPTMALDGALSTPDVDVTRAEVLDARVSDHRPILLEIDA